MTFTDDLGRFKDITTSRTPCQTIRIPWLSTRIIANLSCCKPERLDPPIFGIHGYHGKSNGTHLQCHHPPPNKKMKASKKGTFFSGSDRGGLHKLFLRPYFLGVVALHLGGGKALDSMTMYLPTRMARQGKGNHQTNETMRKGKNGWTHRSRCTFFTYKRTAIQRNQL